jgi:hypothetical protein
VTHWRSSSSKISLTLVLMVMLGGAAAAQEREPAEESVNRSATDEWSIVLTPYAWLAAQSTDVGGEALRQSFNDLASITNFGAQMRVAARWRWLILSADATIADLQSEQNVGPANVDLDIDQVILDLKFGGKVYDNRRADQSGGFALWVAAGGRYWDNTVKTTVTIDPILPGRPPETSLLQETQTWWDPVLGLVFHFPVAPKVGFGLRVTGGGFGIGDASDYLWDAETAAVFKLSRRLSLSVGYRQFKYSRTDGEGDEAVDQTVTAFGPAIGLSIAAF